MQDHRRTKAPSEVMIDAIEIRLRSKEEQGIDAAMEIIVENVIRHCPFLCGGLYGTHAASLRDGIESTGTVSLRIQYIKQWMREETVRTHLDRMITDKDRGAEIARATVQEPAGKGFTHLTFKGLIDDALATARSDHRVSKVGWSEHGYHIRHSESSRRDSPIPSRMKDRVYPKSVSSMITVGLLQKALEEDIQLVVDMCAAPGGKTLELISRLAGRDVQLLSNDISGDRMKTMTDILRANNALQVPGVRVELDTLHGTRIGERFRNQADIVVCDVPCSGIGNLYDDRSFVLPSREFSKELARKQLELLKAAISATRAGGHIAYSTCTLSLTENEAVIDQVRREHSGAIEIVDPRNVIKSSPEWPLDKAVEASLEMQHGSKRADRKNPEFKKPFPAVRLDATTIPGISTGFFAALIRKKS